MGTLAIIAIIALGLAAGGSSRSGGGSGPVKIPPKQPDIPPIDIGNEDDPTIGPDGYPQIVFYEDGSWDEPTEDWFAYAEERIAPLLPPPDASAPEGDYGGFDLPYMVAWEFLQGEVPEGAAYPVEPYAPNAEMWQTSYPGVNYFDGPPATLGLIEHIAAYIDAAMPHFNQTGELILLEEDSF
jgi:hypothetical protein